MFYLHDLTDYLKNKTDCIKATANIDNDIQAVATLTEVYNFDTAIELNEKLTIAKDNPNFIGCKKKFIPAKVKKNEVVREAYWQLKLIFDFTDYE